MAQKVVGYVKLQIPAAKATMAPPVGPALGPYGVNGSAFVKENVVLMAPDKFYAFISSISSKIQPQAVASLWFIQGRHWAV